jgi:hypothetical protein
MINFATATIALLNLLREAMYAANAAEVHAPQDSTYGNISEVLISALTLAFETETFAKGELAERLARLVLDEAIDNGEDIAYQIDLLNRGIIHL